MRQAGATQNARLTPMLNPVSFLATPPGHTPGGVWFYYGSSLSGAPARATNTGAGR